MDRTPIFFFEHTIETTDENDIVTGSTEYNVEVYKIEPADTSVGIMSEGIEDFAVLNQDGDDVTDDLTEDEQDRIIARACDIIRDRQVDDYEE